MKRYSVKSILEATTRYYYIQDDQTLEIVLLPTKYLKHQIKSNHSPNTVKRAAFSICWYMQYLSEMQLEITQVYDMEYDKQKEHFVKFLYWIKGGNHREETDKKNPRNGTCNAYLKDVFRFYHFIETLGLQNGALQVFSYNEIVTENSAGVIRILRLKTFKGYMRAEERNVRAAQEDEIITILQECTNCRDQLLILTLAETGFRIGELLGVDYTKDIDYQNKCIYVYFRDDNENQARAKNAEYRRSKLSDETFAFLMHYMAEYRELIQHQNFLFINIAGKTAGQPFKVSSVYHMLGRLEEKTGIKITPHMLRRYFAVARWNAGWSLELLSQALGHKHLDTTTKYLGLFDDKIIKASKEFYEKYSLNYGIQELL